MEVGKNDGKMMVSGTFFMGWSTMGKSIYSTLLSLIGGDWINEAQMGFPYPQIWMVNNGKIHLQYTIKSGWW